MNFFEKQVNNFTTNLNKTTISNALNQWKQFQSKSQIELIKFVLLFNEFVVQACKMFLVICLTKNAYKTGLPF